MILKILTLGHDHMAHYIITYIGGQQPASPEESKAHFERYKEWLVSLGDAVVSPMNPLKDTTVIKPDGEVVPGTLTEMSGFTLLEVKSMEIAIELAKSCPFLEIGGSLEVSELMQG